MRYSNYRSKCHAENPFEKYHVNNKLRVSFPFPIIAADFLNCPLNMSEQQAPREITQMLIELTDGNEDVVNQILPHIYDELRRLAGSYLRRERADHTLQPTALVHEAYMKLIDQKRVKWQNRAHFFGIAAQVMRRILLDHARKHQAEKRGGEFEKLPIEEEILIVSHDKSAELIALDDALQELAKLDEQKARIVELRYFGGLSIEETAEVVGVSVPTINRQWRMAKAWLFSQLSVD
jgi:RNA polymerase sigma factor (TIGR02999 family)